MEGSFPFTYLGNPMISGRLMGRHFEPLIQKIHNKVASWKKEIIVSRWGTYLDKTWSLKYGHTYHGNSSNSFYGDPKDKFYIFKFFWG